MKKITLLFTFAFCQLAMSQPILNASDFPASYSATGFYSSNITGFTNGPSGADVTWDYSNITPTTPTITYSIVPVSDVGSIAANFPTANFCEKFESNGDNYYELYSLDNQSLQLVAAISTFVANYYDSAVFFQFPYIYQNEFTDTQWQLGQPTPPEPITRTYDGYGTLILPNGTYNNVIRQKMVNGFGQIEYSWYGTSPYRLLMSGNLDFNYARVFGEAVLNNNEIASPKFQFYPNPTSDSFSVLTSDEKLGIKVYDIMGKQLFENTNYTSGSIISLKGHANGIYIVKIVDGNNRQLFSEKIIKN